MQIRPNVPNLVVLPDATNSSSATCLVLSSGFSPGLYSVPKLVLYVELLGGVIVCNTIIFYLMYKPLYNRNIHLQILTIENKLILEYFQIFSKESDMNT